MNSGKRMLRWASGIMLVLGAGHLSLLALLTWENVSGWADRGLWAAVPLLDGGAVPTVASLQTRMRRATLAFLARSEMTSWMTAAMEAR